MFNVNSNFQCSFKVLLYFFRPSLKFFWFHVILPKPPNSKNFIDFNQVKKMFINPKPKCQNLKMTFLHNYVNIKDNKPVCGLKKNILHLGSFSVALPLYTNFLFSIESFYVFSMP